jgi:hypothetical protein
MSETIAVKARNAGLIEILEIKEHPIIANRDIFLLKLKGIEHSKVKNQFWYHLVP